MRKVLTLALTAAVVAFTVPSAVAQISAGSVAGRAVDAAGRGVSGQRVELMRGTLLMSVDTTSSRGDWSFRNVAPGDYVVRMNVRGKIAGARVSVGVGQAVAGTLVVLPTASVSAQLGSLASLLTMIPTAATAVASTAVVATADVETTVVSPAILQTILAQLSPTARQAFAEAILDAIANSESGSSGYAQYKEQFEDIAEDPETPVTFPTPKSDVS